MNGIDATTFTSNPSYAMAFKKSIADSINGTSPSDVVIQSVDATNRRRQLLSSGISIGFLVIINAPMFASPAAAFSALSSQLASAVSSGQFTATLQSNAAAAGATDLMRTSVTGIQTTQVIVPNPTFQPTPKEEVPYTFGVSNIITCAAVGVAIIGFVLLYRNYVNNRRVVLVKGLPISTAPLLDEDLHREMPGAVSFLQSNDGVNVLVEFRKPTDAQNVMKRAKRNKLALTLTTIKDGDRVDTTCVVKVAWASSSLYRKVFGPKTDEVTRKAVVAPKQVTSTRIEKVEVAPSRSESKVKPPWQVGLDVIKEEREPLPTDALRDRDASPNNNLSIKPMPAPKPKAKVVQTLKVRYGDKIGTAVDDSSEAVTILDSYLNKFDGDVVRLKPLKVDISKLNSKLSLPLNVMPPPPTYDVELMSKWIAATSATGSIDSPSDSNVSSARDEPNKSNARHTFQFKPQKITNKSLDKMEVDMQWETPNVDRADGEAKEEGEKEETTNGRRTAWSPSPSPSGETSPPRGSGADEKNDSDGAVRRPKRGHDERLDVRGDAEIAISSPKLQVNVNEEDLGPEVDGQTSRPLTAGDLLMLEETDDTPSNTSLPAAIVSIEDESSAVDGGIDVKPEEGVGRNVLPSAMRNMQRNRLSIDTMLASDTAKERAQVRASSKIIFTPGDQSSRALGPPITLVADLTSRLATLQNQAPLLSPGTNPRHTGIAIFEIPQESTKDNDDDDDDAGTVSMFSLFKDLGIGK